MNVQEIERSFRESVSGAIQVRPEGVDRFRVLTPFRYEDGDHLAIVLSRSNGSWLLSDEGHTFMHLSYDPGERDLQRGTRARIISNALDAHAVEDREGELIVPIPEGRYGDALYSLVQAILHISDVSYLSRERVRSTFMEEVRVFLSERIPPERRVFDWCDPVHDPARKYPVDCRVNGLSRPLFVFALPGDDRVRDANIALRTFESWGLRFRSLAIFEDQEQINRRVLARFSDACEKQFSRLEANRERIAAYLDQALEGARAPALVISLAGSSAG